MARLLLELISPCCLPPSYVLMFGVGHNQLCRPAPLQTYLLLVSSQMPAGMGQLSVQMPGVLADVYSCAFVLLQMPAGMGQTGVQMQPFAAVPMHTVTIGGDPASYYMTAAPGYAAQHAAPVHSGGTNGSTVLPQMGIPVAMPTTSLITNNDREDAIAISGTNVDPQHSPSGGAGSAACSAEGEGVVATGGSRAASAVAAVAPEPIPSAVLPVLPQPVGPAASDQAEPLSQQYTSLI